jgi:ferredoxin-NADP reductase/MOSC domain-containing protein YiiM
VVDAAGRLLSVNVGRPREVAWKGRAVRTAVWKDAVPDRRMVRRLNIDGDGQGDLAGHGGEQRAVLAYQLESYRYWERHLGREGFVFGQFGENLTVEGLPDDEVCIGDRYRVGDAVLEVTQPRVTCYRVGIRMDEPQMAALMVAHQRPGFYLRVLEEGEVGAGDEIVRVATGPERMTVREVSALLYLSPHPRRSLERALRIPALSPGWQDSFRALVSGGPGGEGVAGNPGLAPTAPPPAWAGFRPLQISEVERESSDVISLVLETAGGSPLPPALPGQFVPLRLRLESGAAPIFRSYSMSGDPEGGRYRISVKLEPGGAAGSYLHHRAREGDSLEVGAPRGAFTLQPGAGAVVLLSAGVGATPVLAMLHSLAAQRSRREVWWLYGARNGLEHPFAAESRALVGRLENGRAYVCYSRPRVGDRAGVDFDARGRLSLATIEGLGVARDADFYLCGPGPFMRDLAAGLVSWGVPPTRLHQEPFGPSDASTPGTTGPSRPPHPPPGTSGPGPLVSFARSHVDVPWDPSFGSLLELAEACDVSVRWSCRTGVCHSCETGLLTGAVAYRPEPVEPPAEGDVLICCSQPRAAIILDL